MFGLDLPFIVWLYLAFGFVIACVGIIGATIIETADAWNKERRVDTLSNIEVALERPLAWLGISMLPLLVVEFLEPADFGQALEIALLAVWIIFAAELAARLAVADGRLSYLRKNWFDAIIVLIPIARPLRAARSARALRVARAGRSLPLAVRSFRAIAAVLRERGLQYVLLGATFIVFAGAAVQLIFERERGSIDDYPTALWWSASTMLTIGYGDYVPVTAEGKVLAALISLCGLGLMAWITATIAAHLVEWEQGHKSATTDDLMRKLEGMERDIKAIRNEVRDERRLSEHD